MAPMSNPVMLFMVSPGPAEAGHYVILKPKTQCLGVSSSLRKRPKYPESQLQHRRRQPQADREEREAGKPRTLHAVFTHVDAAGRQAVDVAQRARNRLFIIGSVEAASRPFDRVSPDLVLHHFALAAVVRGADHVHRNLPRARLGDEILERSAFRLQVGVAAIS